MINSIIFYINRMDHYFFLRVILAAICVGKLLVCVIRTVDKGVRTLLVKEL